MPYEDDDDDIKQQYAEMREEFEKDEKSLAANVWRDEIAKKLWDQYQGR